MVEAGGLIRVHEHKNFDVIKLFTENENGILCYNGSPLFSNISLSEEENNLIIKNEDGLFVDGSFLVRFDYDEENDELLFDDKIVSREYTNQQITDMVNRLWATNPFNTININASDLSMYLLKTSESDDSMSYKNTYSRSMNITISNPKQYDLTITIGESVYNTNNTSIEYILPSNNTIEIQAVSEDIDYTENFDRSYSAGGNCTVEASKLAATITDVSGVYEGCSFEITRQLNVGETYTLSFDFKSSYGMGSAGYNWHFGITDHALSNLQTKIEPYKQLPEGSTKQNTFINFTASNKNFLVFYLGGMQAYTTTTFEITNIKIKDSNNNYLSDVNMNDIEIRCN